MKQSSKLSHLGQQLTETIIKTAYKAFTLTNPPPNSPLTPWWNKTLENLKQKRKKALKQLRAFMERLQYGTLYHTQCLARLLKILPWSKSGMRKTNPTEYTSCGTMVLAWVLCSPQNTQTVVLAWKLCSPHQQTTVSDSCKTTQHKEKEKHRTECNNQQKCEIPYRSKILREGSL